MCLLLDVRSLLLLLALFKHVTAATLTPKILLTIVGTQLVYICVSMYHMKLLATTKSPTVLGAIVSCGLLITSILIGKIFGEEMTPMQLVGIGFAIVAIGLMTLGKK